MQRMKNFLKKFHLPLQLRFQSWVSATHNIFCSTTKVLSQDLWEPPRSRLAQKISWQYSRLDPLQPAPWWRVALVPQSQPYAHSIWKKNKVKIFEGHLSLIKITILRGAVWISTLSVKEQSEGSATQIPFLAKAWMIPQWLRLWKLGSAYKTDKAIQ